MGSPIFMRSLNVTLGSRLVDLLMDDRLEKRLAYWDRMLSTALLPKEQAPSASAEWLAPAECLAAGIFALVAAAALFHHRRHRWPWTSALRVFTRKIAPL
jgi:hypothetical protein